MLTLFPGCATTDITDVLPQAVQQTFEAVPAAGGVAVRVVPHPDGDQLSINLGAVDHTLNRVFAGMVHEMARAKFGAVERQSPNRLSVTMTYLNVEERSHFGPPYLHRLDLEVRAEVTSNTATATRLFNESVTSDLEGYAVRADQIYELLLHLVVSIDGFVDAQFDR